MYTQLRCLGFDCKSLTPSPRISTSLLFLAENLTQDLENGQHATTELELLLGDMVSYMALNLTTHTRLSLSSECWDKDMHHHTLATFIFLRQNLIIKLT